MGGGIHGKPDEMCADGGSRKRCGYEYNDPDELFKTWKSQQGGLFPKWSNTNEVMEWWIK